MTGFGKAVSELPGKKITVEIKSLNSKQIDIAARVPSSLRAQELEMRNRVAAILERGKVDVTVYVENVAGDTSVKLNVPALKAYKEDVEHTAAALGIAEPQDWYGVLMRFPDVMRSEAPAEADDKEIECVMTALSDAAGQLMDHRRAEGERLESFFAVRIDRIRQLLELVPQFEEERIAKIRVRMEEGLAKIHGVDYDRSRNLMSTRRSSVWHSISTISWRQWRVRRVRERNSGSSVRKWDAKSTLSARKAIMPRCRKSSCR